MECLRLYPKSSSILFLSSFFILLFFVPSSLSQEHELFSACAPSRCGNISADNMRYPFWVEGQSDYCGYPGFNLSCSDVSAEIEMLTKRFWVDSINHAAQKSIVIVKDIMHEACPLPSTNSTIDPNLFVYTSKDVNLTLYYNCPSSIPIDKSTFGAFPCDLNIDTYAFYSFLSSYNESFRDCSVNVVYLLQKAKTQLQTGSLLQTDPTRFYKAMTGGFEVHWTIDSGWCGECIDSSGRCGFNPANYSQHVCLCRDQPHLGTCSGLPIHLGKQSSSKMKRVVIGAIVAGVVLIGVFLFLLIGSRYWRLLIGSRYWWKKTGKAGNAHNVEEFLENYGSQALRRYTYSDLKKITNSFKDKLGQGGYGGVFKGMLQDGRLVAVKVLNESKGNGEEFINEVASIGKTYHVNVVALLGFCSEGSKRALIYEFMPNGSLEKFIYSEKPRQSQPLEWEKLCQIAIGIARGLEYLHRGCNTRILHFDIKPHNILLDEVFCPKISDFGLAKLCPMQNSTISIMGTRGTVGYIAPEVYCTNIGGVSYKSDVYSYGMMVLEMVGGRKNIDAFVENTSEIYFPHWIYKRLTTYKSIDLHGYLGLHGIETRVEEETARKMILVGLWCIQTNPLDRPSMSRVVEMLEGSVDGLQMPPQPFLSSSP